MSCRHANVRRFHGQLSLRRRHGRPAKLFPLHPHLHHPPPWQLVAPSLLVMATGILLVAMLSFAWRSGTTLFGHFAPGWPWW